jgi:predicted glycoside hydrolase/deacetylase ChbG (UPF0249 family)
LKLIINADDYGKDIPTTQAILDAFSKGLCSSITIIPTGEAYEEAIALAADNNIFERIGLHINLMEGKPLTEPIRLLENFCDKEGAFNSSFHKNRAVRLEGFSRVEKEAVALEIRAQIEKCRKSGLKLTHVDSHYHVHTRWEVWQVAKPLLREYGLTKVRISRNCGEKTSLTKLVYKYWYNKRLNRAGFKTVDYFGSAKDVACLFSEKPQIISSEDVVEVMIHPLYKTAEELLDLDGCKLEEAVKAIVGWESAVSYASL